MSDSGSRLLVPRGPNRARIVSMSIWHTTASTMSDPVLNAFYWIEHSSEVSW